MLSIRLSSWQRVAMAKSSPAPRRIGTANSKTRAQLVDAAERVLLEDGYAAVTSRRVAAAAGLKPQLVHYYFRTMDDLFLEVFRRRADENIARAHKLMSADTSLRALWELNSDPRGAAFNIEFVALGNHRKVIRAEIADYAERFRVAQLEALSRALQSAGVEPSQLPPVVALLLLTGLTQILALERALGVSTGHDATLAFVESTLEGLEPVPRRSVGPAAAD